MFAIMNDYTKKSTFRFSMERPFDFLRDRKVGSKHISSVHNCSPGQKIPCIVKGSEMHATTCKLKMGMTVEAKRTSAGVYAVHIKVASNVWSSCHSCKIFHCVALWVDGGAWIFKRGGLWSFDPDRCYSISVGMDSDFIETFLDATYLKLKVYLTLDWERTAQGYVAELRGPTWSEDLTKLIREERKAFSDVCLSCQGRQIKSHKLLLAARSNVFKAMLESSFREAQENAIDIDDSDADVMKLFVDFVSTDEIDPRALAERCRELLVVAEKYNVKRLKSLCEIQIEKEVGVENCADSIILGDLYNSKLVLERALKFLKRFREDVEETEGWQRIVDKPELLSTVTLKLDQLNSY